MIPSFLIGYITGIATLWAFIEVVSFAAAQRGKTPTKNKRRVQGWQPLPGGRMPPPPAPQAREPDMADVAGIGDRELVQPLYMYGIGAEDFDK